MNRRRFLNPHRRAVIRPPWSLAEGAFVDACTRCDACVKSCPTQIIVRGDGGYPEIDFRRGECLFEGDCVRACPSSALSAALEGQPWQLVAAIGPGCLTHQGVMCSLCREACEYGAIGLLFKAGAVARPEVEADLCSGCGACVAPCPAQAVALAPRQRSTEENY